MMDLEVPTPSIVGEYPIAAVFQAAVPQSITILADLQIRVDQLRNLFAIRWDREVHVVNSWPVEFNCDYWYVDKTRNLLSANPLWSLERELRRVANNAAVNWIRYSALALKYKWETIDTDKESSIYSVRQSFEADPASAELLAVQHFGAGIIALLNQLNASVLPICTRTKIQ